MTMAAEISSVFSDRARAVRIMSAAVAGIVFVDAAAVGAPGLALLGVPFLVAALTFRKGKRLTSAALALWSAFYVAIGINFIAATGLDAGWGDLLFAYAGTPVAAALCATLLGRFVTHRTEV